MSSIEWLAEMMMMEDGKLPDNLTPQQLAAPFGDDFQQLHSSEGFSPDTNTRKSPDAKDHVMAERKRRAKLSQHFISLATLVPGIKKIDKCTVLDCCIEYLKHLEERVKALEEQNSKQTMESVTKFFIHDSSNDNLRDELQPLPQIEARISERNVLIRIHCGKGRGVLVNVLAETEKLNLSVVNSSVIPFGNSTLDITIMAQMDSGFIMTAKDIGRSLQSSLIQFRGENVPPENKN